MSLQRTCAFCGAPVSIRRRMSIFCSERCEHLHRHVSQAPPHSPLAHPARPNEPAPRKDAKG